MTNSDPKKHRWHNLVYFLIYVFIILVFAGSAFVMCKRLVDFKQSIDEFEQAAEIANVPDMSDLIDAYNPEEQVSEDDGDTQEPESNSPDEAEAPNLSQTDLYEIILERLGLTHIEALQEINPDVIGWIYVTATDISYPILQGEDNDEYIHASWTDNTKPSTAGSIFMDSDNDPSFSDFNSIIYGHRMQNETMFGKLKYYKSKDYWQAHPDVYIVTPDRILRYDIYAAYEVSVQGQTYSLDFEGADSKSEYIDYTLSMAKYDTGIAPTSDDLILTLITCTASDSSARWAVQAVMREEILRYAEE